MKNIWCFAPNEFDDSNGSGGSNLLINISNYEVVNEVREYMEMAFKFASKKGILCE
jgi:hypothetical protein